MIILTVFYPTQSHTTTDLSQPGRLLQNATLQWCCIPLSQSI